MVTRQSIGAIAPDRERSPATFEGLRAVIGRTPLARIEVHVDGRVRDVYLKLESANPYGSLKDRTALSLVESIGVERLRGGDIVLIESTSGNLGVALAAIARLVGVRFIAVVDPKTPPRMLEEMRSYGADVEMLFTPDARGCYLQGRLRRVRELCDTVPGGVWVNQYANQANPNAHQLTTAPEIDVQTEGRLDAVFVPVSTGGTLTGVARYLRASHHETRIIAVDVVGSIVFGDDGRRQRLTGIGASRKSDFIRPWHYDEVRLVSDSQAFAFCRALQASTGIALGGSGGAVLAACCQYLALHPEVRWPVCVMADGGERYRQTIYDDRWLGQEDLELAPVLLASPVSGARFEFLATDDLRECP